MEKLIRKATFEDLDAVAAFYRELIDHMNATDNLTFWQKDTYPNGEGFKSAILTGTMHVLEACGQIAGVFILNAIQAPQYKDAKWRLCLPEDGALVIHQLACRPGFQKRGVARALMEFAEQQAREQGYKAIRLDTCERNVPAQNLYKKLGYQPCGRVDLELGPRVPAGVLFACFEKEM